MKNMLKYMALVIVALHGADAQAVRVIRLSPRSVSVPTKKVMFVHKHGRSDSAEGSAFLAGMIFDNVLHAADSTVLCAVGALAVMACTYAYIKEKVRECQTTTYTVVEETRPYDDVYVVDYRTTPETVIFID